MKTNLLQLFIISCVSLFTFSTATGQSASCDTLYNYVNGDPFFEISGEDGAALGHDKLTDGTTIDAWAEPYNVSSPIQVRALYFAPWLVHDQGGSVTFNVYQNNAGVPGSVLATEVIPISDFTENTYYKLEFSNPTTVNGDFFVGYELNYAALQDSFAITGTHKVGGTNFTLYQESGVWEEVVNTYTISGDPFVSAWAMRILCSNAPAPTADFTVNTGLICLGGGAFEMDASGSTNADYYEYSIRSNDQSITYVEQNGTVTTAALAPTVVGDDQILALFAHGGCASVSTGGLVDVFAPVSATNTTVNSTCGNNNGSITVTNPTGGSGTYSYSVDGSTPQSNSTFNNLTAGSHTVTVLSSGLGCSYSMNVTVNATPQEMVTVNAGATICAGASTSVTASGTGTIEWFDGTNSLGTTASVNVSPTVTTVYDATLTDANGCTDTKQVTVSVNALPAVSAGSNTGLCIGSSKTLAASGASTYSWDNGLGTGATHSVNPTSATTYTVTGTDGNGCVNTDQITISINSLPTVVAGNDVTICNGETTLISATGGSSYAWDNGLTAGASHNVTPAGTTTYQVTGTDANGCVNSDQVTVNVNTLPTISAGSDVAICTGGSTTIAATGGNSYNWNNTLGAGASHSVSPNTTTTYEVTGTGANGCENTATVTVTLNQYDDATFTFNNFCELSTTNGPSNIIASGGSFNFNPAPTDGANINASTGEISNGVNGASYVVEYTTNGTCPSTSTETVSVQSNDDPSFSYNNICLGNGLTVLPNNIATPGGTYTFETVPTDGATIEVSTGEVINPTLGTSYAVEYTTPTGACQATSVENITVYTAPTVNLSATATTICENETTDLEATGNATAYAWNNGLSSAATHSLTPVSTTTYVVTGTDANGCTNAANETINVNALPSVDAGVDQAICENETVNMTATGAVSYAWDNGLGNGATQSITATSTTTFIVTGTDANNCENTDQITVSVNPMPIVDAGQGVTICNGDQITITANGANTYNWDNSLGAGAAHNVSPTVTTTYIVTGTGLNACENTDQIVVTVTAIPTVNAGVDQTVCEGSDVTLTASNSSNSTLSWDNGVDNGTAFVATTSTTYTATADLNGCTATDQVIVNVNALPSVSAGNNQTTCVGYAPILLTGSPVGGTFSGTGVSNNEFDPATAGTGPHTLTYSYTDGNGCENSSTVEITVDGCASVEENDMAIDLSIRPNPATSYIEIETTAEVKQINMISAIGQHVSLEVHKTNNNTTKLDVSHLVKGVYFVVVSLENENIVRKVIIH
jgi:hypothetical protein